MNVLGKEGSFKGRAGGENIGKYLHNTQNVSQFDTYVSSLKNSKCVFFLTA